MAIRMNDFIQALKLANKENQENRKKALKRDKNKCQVCFKKGKVVHHIKPRRLFNEDTINDANKLFNLITLCDKHHVPVEIGKIPCPKPMVS